MDGKLMLRTLRDLLGETSTSEWFDNFTAYSYLNQAAFDFANRTECLRSEQTISTVADQSEYDLNADFLGFYLRDGYNQFFLKLYDGTNYSWLYYKDYNDVYLNNAQTGIERPTNFTITTSDDISSSITGTATSSGAASAGKCTLTDTAATFSTSGVTVGDMIHNTTDGSMGKVLSVTSETALVCALFDGTGNDWTSSDAYVIQPQNRSVVIIDPPPSVSGYSITVPYVQAPNPVYSDYGKWRFPDTTIMPIVQYAAWLYKYRDREPQFGDIFFQHYEAMVRKFAARSNKSVRIKDRVAVNMRVRTWALTPNR